jgi:hypothetical protein
MRIERDGTNTIASGDLYRHSLRTFRFPFPFQPPRPEPDPGAGIPIFPISDYRYYLRVTQILEWITLGDSFTLGFELHSVDKSTYVWTNTGTFTAQMQWKPAPAGYPNSSAYLEGDVKDASGQLTGRLTMGWVSKYLRKATIELDAVSDSEIATDNGLGTGWQDTMDQVGWEINVDVSDTNVPEESGASWANSEMHKALLERRDADDLDAEWRYHLLHVRQLDATSRGIMYDAYGGDSNKIPREGAGISSHWVFPNEARWGTLQGDRFGTADGPYYRTAVHELGHAFGLHHNTASNRIMNTTGTIASAGSGTFPANILYEFEADDAKKLRHWPDLRVRPGGVPFGESYAGTPLSPDDFGALDVGDRLEVVVKPLLDAVPLGAPVRVDIAMTNRSGGTVPVPPNLGLKDGFAFGRVVNPSGGVREFVPLVVCLDDVELDERADGEAVEGAMTLLRGPQGALFPAPGLHTVEVNVRWNVDGVDVEASGSASVMITAPVDEEHASAARAVLDEPDLLLTLAIGGDHLVDGLAALDTAMDNSELAPHYAIIKAKQVGRRFGARRADAAAAAAVIDEGTVMSGYELLGAAELLDGTRKATRDKAVVKKMVTTLKKKARTVPASDAVLEKVKDL